MAVTPIAAPSHDRNGASPFRPFRQANEPLHAILDSPLARTALAHYSAPGRVSRKSTHTVTQEIRAWSMRRALRTVLQVAVDERLADLTRELSEGRVCIDGLFFDGVAEFDAFSEEYLDLTIDGQTYRVGSLAELGGVLHRHCRRAGR